MSDQAEAETDDLEAEDEVWARETAPQTPFTLRQVGIGIAIAVVGAAIAFGVPLALA